jgi:dihydrofolate reductase
VTPTKETIMGKVIATITTSVDGYVTGPDDGPGNGLGTGGERLHYWVMGGPWTYETDHEPGAGMSGPDKEFYDALVASIGSGIVGRGMYESSEAWGGTNPFDGTLYVLTHRVQDQPDESAGFRFVDGFDEALALARADAGERDVALSGGADLIRQGLRAGVVDELVLSTAPVVLGGGKRLFDGFTDDVDLEIKSVHHSPWAVHTRYAVRR